MCDIIKVIHHTKEPARGKHTSSAPASSESEQRAGKQRTLPRSHSAYAPIVIYLDTESLYAKDNV
jgi:hypothetical protein